MDVKKRANIITEWINNYCDSASYKPKSLVVGISGGIDSSVYVQGVSGIVRRWCYGDSQWNWERD